ncbi:hypothetical protein ACSQ67_011204 [Phaseolus vulgaris]
MMPRGGQCFEKLRRFARTVFFVAALLASLLVTSLPVLVAVVDVLVPCVLVSSFTCVKCYGFTEHLRRYAFKSSLTDIPLVSVIRSFVIICVYSICDGPALSHGPYLGTVTLSSFISIVLLSVKACVFSVNSQIEAEATISPTRQRLHLKKSWGMPVLFLSSVVFALGHTVVAYRTSCRARRKLMFHRVDPEAVLSCKNVFSGYQKVPRSPVPSEGRTPKSDGEMKRKPFGTARDEELPLRLLADSESLFIPCQGLTLHYKLSMPGSPPLSMSSTFCSTSSVAVGLSKLNRHLTCISPKAHRQLYRSYSNQFYGSSLHAPLLDVPVNSPHLNEEIPVLHLDEIREDENTIKLESLSLEQTVEDIGQVDLLLSFCSEIGFSSVVMIGHDDGGLLALLAAQRVQTSMNSFNVTVKGVVLLNVNLSREVVPSFAKILLHTSLGKKHLVRPLLRTEITHVVNRRSWYDATKLTTEVLTLYKAPLYVEGWDEALHEIGKLSSETILSTKNADLLLQSVEDIPVLVIAGAEDSLVSMKYCQAMASKFLNSRLVAISGCGHLPHEECPMALLAAISPFINKLFSVYNSQSQ